MALHFPELTMLPLERYGSLLASDTLQRALERISMLRARLAGRVVWNISSTAVGGGVAEMVRSALAYARGAGVDARWAVIDAPPEFFRITKRIHNAIHGSTGDGSAIGGPERQLYEHVNRINAAELVPMLRPHDIVLVHDPQPAGMIPDLLACGAHVIWRCHIGQDFYNEEVERGWRFLEPYIAPAHAYVFTRPSYVPVDHVDARRAAIIAPTLDPFSAKNQPLTEGCVRGILKQIGLIQSPIDASKCSFMREDGTPDRVDRMADIVRDGEPPLETTPLIVQASRWDRLKDPIGVLAAFARLDITAAHGAHLVLAGPGGSGVSDDPEGDEVLGEVIVHWRRLPPDVRERVHLVSLPTADVDENAAMVNALQRHATIIVQKSLHEGFGLTVTEAMWKARPVVATAVGGIQDQIESGVQGILIQDPADLDACADAMRRLLDNPEEARRMGERGHARVVERYLGLASLLRFGSLIELIDDRYDIERAPRTASWS